MDKKLRITSKWMKSEFVQSKTNNLETERPVVNKN